MSSPLWTFWQSKISKRSMRHPILDFRFWILDCVLLAYGTLREQRSKLRLGLVENELLVIALSAASVAIIVQIGIVQESRNSIKFLLEKLEFEI